MHPLLLQYRPDIAQWIRSINKQLRDCLGMDLKNVLEV